MTILTLDEVTDTFSEGLEQWQWDENRKWVLGMYNLLNQGGMLMIPNTGQIFEKNRWGFVEKVTVEQ